MLSKSQMATNLASVINSYGFFSTKIGPGMYYKKLPNPTIEFYILLKQIALKKLL